MAAFEAMLNILKKLEEQIAGIPEGSSGPVLASMYPLKPLTEAIDCGMWQITSAEISFAQCLRLIPLIWEHLGGTHWHSGRLSNRWPQFLEMYQDILPAQPKW